MIHELILNMSLLVSLTVVSGFIDRRWDGQTPRGRVLQGGLFGVVAILGMLHPLNFGPGLIFDGRSILISLSALFFGPVAAAVTAGMALLCRVALGGAGTLTGVLVILASLGLGLLAHNHYRITSRPPSAAFLYLFGVLVHGVMLALMFTLPAGGGLAVVMSIGLPVMLFYPVTTVLAGKILSDQIRAHLLLTELHRTTENLAITLHSIGDAVLATDTAGKVVLMNPVAEALTGWTLSEAQGKPVGEIFRIINEDTRATVPSPIERVLREGCVVGLANHTLLIAKDLSERPIADSAAPIRDQDGVLNGVVLIFRDQTAEHAAQRELATSAARYQRLIETTGTLPWEFDIVTERFTFVGPQIEALFGVPPSAWQTMQDWAAMIHPVDREHAVNYCHARTLQGRDHVVECRFVTASGAVRWVKDTVSVHLEEGQPVRISGFITDCTELKEAIAALQAGEEKMRLILNATAEGIYGVDQHGICLFVNAAAQQLLGYREDEMVGQSVHDLLAHTDINGEEVEKHDCRLSNVLATGTPCYNDDGILWKGNQRWLNVEYRIHPIRQGDEIVGAVVTFLDITEKKKMLEQRLLSGQMASLGELAAGVAHEINNPIGGVINYAQILLNRAADDDTRQRTILSNIVKEGNRIAAIVGSLLKYAYKNKEPMTAVDVGELIHETLNLISLQILRDGILIELDVAPDLPPVHANFQQLEQVMINLVSNARHALNQKYPTTDAQKILRINAATVGAGGGAVEIVVRDQGVGIPKINRQRVFNQFFTTKPAGEGTGLGLSIIYGILKEHGASIEIDSEEGCYTQVTMRFQPVVNTTKNEPQTQNAGSHLG